MAAPPSRLAFINLVVPACRDSCHCVGARLLRSLQFGFQRGWLERLKLIEPLQRVSKESLLITRESPEFLPKIQEIHVDSVAEN